MSKISKSENKKEESKIEDKEIKMLKEYQQYINGKKIIVLAENSEEANKLINLLVQNQNV